MKAQPGGWLLPVCLLSGALSAHLINQSLPLWLLAFLACGGLYGLVTNRLRMVSLALLAFCWTLFQIDSRLADRLDGALAGGVLEVQGTVSSIPTFTDDYARFQFEPDPEFQDLALPGKLLVYWFRSWPELHVGQSWQLRLKLKPPWGRVNFQGPDQERWFFANGVGAIATAYDGELQGVDPRWRFSADRARASVIRTVAGYLSGSRQLGIVQALATADRSAISSEDKRLLAATGTSHLLAISGLHIALAAAGGMWLGRLLLWPLPGRLLLRVSLPVLVGAGLLSASLYSALAGFGTPTVRSVLMLFTALLAVLLARTIHPFRAWLISLTVIVLTDSFAPLNAGFWFSFIAVAALLTAFLPRTGELGGFKTALLAQTAVIVTLLPVTAMLFFSFSPSAFLANLFAIPWVSLMIVPPVLVGLVLSPISELATGLLWTFAGEASSLLFAALEWIDRLQGELPMLAPPSRMQVLLALAGALFLWLPPGLPIRWMGLFLVTPLFIPAGNRTGPGELEMEVLDAGQGTAVVLSVAGQTMLYDSGPGDGQGYDLVNSVISPALAVRGADSLEHVIISHADLDHAGGLGSLLSRFHEAAYLGNLTRSLQAVSPCVAPYNWSWSGVQFRVLHPGPGLPYLGNDSSCVLSVSSGQYRVLLSGDISSSIENRLILDGIQPHSLVLVPHHGSKSSSSFPFIQRLAPRAAIATAGLGNRFDFPRPEVRSRYVRTGSDFWSTGECGAIRIMINADGSYRATSARRVRNRAWRWPVAANCP